MFVFVCVCVCVCVRVRGGERIMLTTRGTTKWGYVYNIFVSACFLNSETDHLPYAFEK